MLLSYIVIFVIFKMHPPPSWIFKNLKFQQSVRSRELMTNVRHLAKFHQNWLNGCGDMAI